MLFLYDWKVLLFYLVMLLFFLFSIFILLFKKERIDNIVFFILSFILILFYGLRTNGSPDTYMYLNRFYNLGSLDDFEWSPPFYYLLYFIRWFGQDHYTYTILSSAVFVFLVSTSIFFIFKSASKTLCISFFFINWSIYDLVTNTYRQGIASAIILLALALFFRKKYILGSLLLLLSIGFHWSSVLILFLALLAFLFNKEKIVKFLFVFICSYYMISLFKSAGVSTILANMDTFFYAVGDFTGYNIGNKQSAYLNDGVVGAKFYDLVFVKKIYSTIDFIIPLAFVGLYFFQQSKIKTPMSKSDLYIFNFFCFLALYFVFLIDMTWFFRNMYWLVTLSPIILTKTVERIIDARGGGSRNHTSVVFFAVFIFVFFSVISSVTLWRSEILRLNVFESY